jgi:DNA-directed RNA polymerase subunit RPC12/RpoP
MQRQKQETKATGGSSKIKTVLMIGIPLIISVIVIVFVIKLINEDGNKKPIFEITCKSCQGKFTVLKEGSEDKPYFTCTLCGKKVIFNEQQSILEADEYINKAQALIKESDNYTQSDPTKVKVLLKETSEMLDKGAEFYQLIPSAQSMKNWDLMLNLRRVICSKRTL